MNNKRKQLILAICSSIICTTAIAQTAAPTLPINSKIGVGMQAPFLLGVAANAARSANAANQQTNMDNNTEQDTAVVESKPNEKPVVPSESEREKALKAAVLAKDPGLEQTKENKANINIPSANQPKQNIENQQSERITGQVPINNRIIRTNDIRLWNDSSIKEKEEVGQKNLLEALGDN